MPDETTLNAASTTERAVAARLQSAADFLMGDTSPRIDSRVIRATDHGWVEIRASYLEQILEHWEADRGE